MTDLPSRFIGSPIEPVYDEPPVLKKRPGAPSGFVWQGRRFRVARLIAEWHDYGPRGKLASFYEKERGSYRALAAKRRGSWGVGRDYFRVEVEGGGVYELYYDRAPTKRGREGGWYLFREILSGTDGPGDDPASSA